MNRNKVLLGHRKNGLPIWLAQGGAPDELEQVQGKLSDLLKRMEALDEEMAKAPDGTPEQRDAITKDREQRWAAMVAEQDQLKAEESEIEGRAKAREERAKRLADARSKYQTVGVKPGAKGDADLFDVDFRRMGDESTHDFWQTRSAEVLDSKSVQRHLRPDQRARIEKIVSTRDGDTDGELIAAYLVATSNPHYRSAFQKAACGFAPVFTAEEGRAVRDVNNLKRAMSVGTSSAGGYAVPVVIDPTIILTAQGSDNPILQRARIETITNDKWKGLSSAGVTWKFGAEGSASTDNSPTIAQPEVDTHRADGFIPFSIEIGMDWPGFAERMSQLLGEGYDELLAEKLTTGTGADTPVGVLERLAAQTSPDVSNPVGTASTVVPGDIYDMWARLPQRHRNKGTTAWMSSTDFQNAVRQLGTLDPNFTVNMTAERIPQLFGRDYPLNDYYEDLTTGTGVQPYMVVGDWQGFLVAQRAGMNIEFVPMLFDVTNNRPTGQRGWFAWARIGSDVVDPTAFQLLTNKSS